MTDVQGSKAVFSFILQKTAGTNPAQVLKDKLKEAGWRWFKDYMIENTTYGCTVEVFNKELISVIKEIIVENNI